jgi:hypothetical protein
MVEVYVFLKICDAAPSFSRLPLGNCCIVYLTSLYTTLGIGSGT